VAFLSFAAPLGWRRVLVSFGVVTASIIGLIPAVMVLGGGKAQRLEIAGTLPGLTFSLGIDSLSAFFLIPICFISALAAFYAFDYTRSHPTLQQTLPFFPILTASMLLVVTARDGFLFLLAWEVMTLSSFLLVTTEHEHREVRHAGWIYLIAAHLATAFLLIFFTLLYVNTGSLAFAGFHQLKSAETGLTSLLFFLALVGFGTKAGFFPLHVWLPHAHPAAPSYISAIMSGVMIKTGIYGILRALTWLGPPPLGWGSWLVFLGITSAILGILLAHPRQDFKRLLAYSSVENMGIIGIGLGASLWGVSAKNPFLTALALGGTLFHIWNHSLFKSLWFLSAGCVVESTGTRLMDRLGGLSRKMPSVSLASGVATAALCGLPPLNGFVSEWLIYMALYQAVLSFSGWALALAVAGIGGMALTGGLALAVFTKLFGTIFLGEPRTVAASSAHDLPALMRWPLLLLAALCLLLGLVPRLLASWLNNVIQSCTPTNSEALLTSPLQVLQQVSLGSTTLILVMLVLWLLFRLRRKDQTVRSGVTWDCGYHAPTPRMQYTAASFSEPIDFLFSPLLRLHRRFEHPHVFFPAPSSFKERSEDLAEGSLFRPLFETVDQGLTWLRARQQGRVQNYMIWIFLTMLVLLFWEVWFGI
jgi:hydrogenase-4 component B